MRAGGSILGAARVATSSRARLCTAGRRRNRTTRFERVAAAQPSEAARAGKLYSCAPGDRSLAMWGPRTRLIVTLRLRPLRAFVAAAVAGAAADLDGVALNL